MSSYITLGLLFPVITLTALAVFFVWYWQSVLPKRGTLEYAIAQHNRPGPLSFTARRHPMEKADHLPLLVITLVYAATAFFQLGSFTNPQSFTDLGGGEPLEITLTQDIYLDKFMYYGGLGTGQYNLEISSDGDHWSTLWTREEDGKTVHYWADAAEFDPSFAVSQKYSELFKWIEIQPNNPQYVRHLRITGKADKALINLGELALYNNGQPYTGDPTLALFDEPEVVPEKSTWYNSTFFDEIYHARTALEHIEGVAPYEVSHPPLGKLILSLGIQLFGMTPFGWRFMGTLFGVLMLPVLYVFLKNLFGKTPVAACGTALFAFDFMHLTQTRIATIDTYGVFFILCMYFFMYRYLTLPPGTSVMKSALPLLLSGLCFGLGAASKWTAIYAGAGLALVYFIGLYFKWRDWPRDGEDAPRFGPWLVGTLALSVAFFVLIPGFIYTLSYLPYAAAKGDMSLSNTFFTMLDNQKFMFTYHEGVMDTHPYSSRWYQWIVDGRPILYYLDNKQTAETGLKAAFGCFNNPVVAWGGLVALVSITVQLFLRRCGKALFILVGYLSQLLPWMFIGRTTFEYHYFPSTLFLVLALAYVFSDLMDAQPKTWKKPVYALTGGAVALYFCFYPVLIGLTVPEWYTNNFLKWLPSWPF